MATVGVIKGLKCKLFPSVGCVVLVWGRLSAVHCWWGNATTQKSFRERQSLHQVRRHIST